MTEELTGRFLELLADGWYVKAAAREAGVRRRQSLYEARARDPQFAAAWDAAVEEGLRVLDEEADVELEARGS